MVPITVSVKPIPPAVAVVDERLVAVGSGLLIVKTNGGDSTLVPGSKTVTGNVPASAISDASIGVVNFVESTNVVRRSRLLMRITRPGA